MAEPGRAARARGSGVCITWGMARRLPPPRGLPAREVEKCVCRDDRDVKNKDNRKEIPWHGVAFPQSSRETRANTEGGARSFRSLGPGWPAELWLGKR